MGFKWFVDGLGSGAFGFAGEESAGASFLKRDGSVWTTDKDGVVMGLLAAEILAKTGRDPSQLFAGLTAELGTPFYERIDVPATPQQKNALKALAPEQLGLKDTRRRSGAGDPDQSARQRSILWRHQGRDRAGLVRGKAIGDRGRLQDLRRKFSWGRSSEADPAGRQGGDREGVLNSLQRAPMFSMAGAPSANAAV